MVLRRHKQNDVIFPTAQPSLCLSLLPSLHHYFSPFLSPQCNLIRLDCPLATSPSGHVVLCPIPAPPSLLPLYRFLWSGSVWLMSSNPISQCSHPSPAGGFSHAIQPDQSEWPPPCILITVSEPENTFTNYKKKNPKTQAGQSAQY